MKCINQRLRGQAAASSSSAAEVRAPWRAKHPGRRVGKPWQRTGEALGGLTGSSLTQNTKYPLYLAKPESCAGAACSFNWKGGI